MVVQFNDDIATTNGNGGKPAASQEPKKLSVPSADEFEHDFNLLANDTMLSTSLTLLTALRASNVEFIRYCALDASGNMRCKAVPLDRLLSDPSRFYSGGLSIAEICFAGLLTGADHMAPGCNLSSARVLTVKPDIASLRVLPYSPSTAVVFGTLHDQRTGDTSSLCTRHLLSRVIQTAEKDFGLAFAVGAELEFCLVHEEDGRPVDESCYGYATTLTDRDAFVSDLYKQLKLQSIAVEQIHAESAPGQVEVVLEHQDDVMRIADSIVMARETVRACARAHNLRALFLPKVYGDQAGNGLHIHMSFRDLSLTSRHLDRENSFRRASVQGQLSSRGSSFLEGLLQHLPALLAVTIPSVNSFRRVGKGCWTGHTVGWAVEDKECPLRVCIDGRTGNPTNVELKLSDSTSNIYMSLACILSAGLDGIATGMRLRPMVGEECAEVEPLPKTFEESLDHLQNDALLSAVLGKDLLTGYSAIRKAEVEEGKKSTLEEEVKMAFQRA